MAHIAKFKASQVKGLLEHNSRTDETRPHNHSNEDIDPEKTKLNYELCEGNGTAYQRYKDRLSQVHCMKRDDVTVLDSLVVTLPKDVKPEDERKFFKAVYEFACNDYGKENIVNATVHMDETTPHIHLGFIPVVQGKLRNGEPVEKVRHSALITKKYLEKMHTRLSDFLEKELGYEVEILNGATANANKTIAELKAERAEKRAKQAEEKAAFQEQRADRAEERAIQAENKAHLAAEKAETEEQRAVQAETALVNLLDNVPPFVAPAKKSYPDKPIEPKAPDEEDYDLSTRRGVKGLNKARDKYHKDHDIWKNKVLPKWEEQRRKIDEAYQKEYDKAYSEWADKFLTPENLAKAKAMVEDKSSKLDTMTNKVVEERKTLEADRQELAERYQERSQALDERERVLNRLQVNIAVQARTMADTIMYNAGYEVNDSFIQNQIENENEMINEEIDNYER